MDHVSDSELTRTPSAVDEVAESLVDGLLSLSPELAVELGVPSTGLDDFSPAGIDAIRKLNHDSLAALAEVVAATDPAELDEVDAVTIDAMRERLGVENELIDAGLTTGVVNVIASPTQIIRDLFDLLPTSHAADWDVVAEKLRAVPTALAGYQESLQWAISNGREPAAKQVREVVTQAEALAGSDSRFTELVGQAQGTVPADRDEELATAARQAAAAYGQLADFMRDSVLPQTKDNEACGREDYELFSRYFLGASVDLDATYAWGLDELARIDQEQRTVAGQILPGASLREVMDHLDNDPARKLHGADALQRWMQGLAEEAIQELAKEHFDIPQQLQDIECMIAPSGTGGIYYTPPSEDFSRPGRMWWAVPKNVTEFATWQEATTVYHEGVPGHHLQIGQTVMDRDRLNRWRRLICWVSGHGEGWALYAERLMAELGYLADPGDYFGMLDSQRMRAARVVVDIGFHLGLTAPESVGGGTWNRAKAWQFLTDNVAMEHNFLAFELDRYLGWPGQAPSYKIGQNLWEEIRAESQARAGADFNLKEFHRSALAVGSVGLDTLRRALLT